jgi:hypothetical protein
MTGPLVPKNGKPVALDDQREAADVEHAGAIAGDAVAKQIARKEYGAWCGVAVYMRRMLQKYNE